MSWEGASYSAFGQGAASAGRLPLLVQATCLMKRWQDRCLTWLHLAIILTHPKSARNLLASLLMSCGACVLQGALQEAAGDSSTDQRLSMISTKVEALTACVGFILAMLKSGGVSHKY